VRTLLSIEKSCSGLTDGTRKRSAQRANLRAPWTARRRAVPGDPRISRVLGLSGVEVEPKLLPQIFKSAFWRWDCLTMVNFVADEVGVDFAGALHVGVLGAIGVDRLRAQAEANAVRRDEFGGAQEAEDAAARGAAVGREHGGSSFLLQRS
jgi:hypothetical protein